MHLIRKELWQLDRMLQVTALVSKPQLSLSLSVCLNSSC